MASRNFADLMSRIPGDYLFQRQSYDRGDGFHEDLDWTERFCLEHGFVFETIRAPRSERIDAFSVQIRRG